MGGQAASALVLLDFRPMTVTRLAERLRLSQPGAVRLVDRLADAGYVVRRSGEDRRTVRVSLTKSGMRRVAALRRQRSARLAAVTSSLSAPERETLGPLLEKLIQVLTTDIVDAYANCRLCDIPTCQAGGCPVDALARSHRANEEAP